MEENRHDIDVFLLEDNQYNNQYLEQMCIEGESVDVRVGVNANSS
jgi:hypothetical protein